MAHAPHAPELADMYAVDLDVGVALKSGYVTGVPIT
jgi:hypothetical protein